MNIFCEILHLRKKKSSFLRKYDLATSMSFRAWYVDGRVLVVIVTFGIILPLCLLKNLGKERSGFYPSLYSAHMSQKPKKMNNFACSLIKIKRMINYKY